MQSKRTHVLLVGALSVIVLFSSACSKANTIEVKENNTSEAKKEATVKPREPVTLKFFTIFSDDRFQAEFKEPLQKKLPHITLEHVSATPANLDKLITGGTIPDLIYFGNPTEIPDLVDKKLAMDMSDLVKKHQFDLNRLDPNLLNGFRSYGPNQQLMAIPFSRSAKALVYNKDIFDKFNVPYPIDGMTWDETISLAAKLTRVVDGVQYYGLNIMNPEKAVSQLNVNYVDPKTDKPMFTTEESFKKVLSILQRTWDIPGNLPKDGKFPDFYKDQTIAMQVMGANLAALKQAETNNKLNWNMVTYPIHAGNPPTIPDDNSHGITIVPASKYKDDAFLVIEQLLSNEYMTARVRRGDHSSLKDVAILKQISADEPQLSNKNLQALFVKIPSAPGPQTRGKWETIGQSFFLKAITSLRDSGKDINTVLRDTQELTEKEIAKLKGQ